MGVHYPEIGKNRGLGSYDIAVGQQLPTNSLSQFYSVLSVFHNKIEHLIDQFWILSFIAVNL